MRYPECESCANLIPIGEGDHICNECGEPKVVIEDYFAASSYLMCDGEHYVEN